MLYLPTFGIFTFLDLKIFGSQRLIWVLNQKIGGKPNPKWMAYNNGKPYEQMDDLGGKPTIFGSIPLYIYIYTYIHPISIDSLSSVSD